MMPIASEGPLESETPETGKMPVATEADNTSVADTKMRLAILVTSSPYGEQGSASAFHFCLAAIDAGHQITGIFFYQQGTENGNSFITPATDEFNLHQAWVDLAEQHSIALDVCISAALRRGIRDNSEESVANLDAPFQLSGLGQLAELIADSDRLVQF